KLQRASLADELEPAAAIAPAKAERSAGCHSAGIAHRKRRPIVRIHIQSAAATAAALGPLGLAQAPIEEVELVVQGRQGAAAQIAPRGVALSVVFPGMPVGQVRLEPNLGIQHAAYASLGDRI